MTEDELEALLEGLEAALEEDVRAALALTAQDFAGSLDGATEIVAARFSVSVIRDLWRQRVGPLITRLRGIATRGAEVSAEDLGEELPDGWEMGLDGYVTATRALLDAVGDRMAVAASQALAEGPNRGEDVDALRARLLSVFDTGGGAQLGDSRAARIAMTEATRAFNAGSLAAAQALSSPDRPLVKQWITRRDDRVREAHADANGQLQLLDDPFDVGGVPVRYPGDPAAPAELTVGCRCIARYGTATTTEESAVTESLSAAADVRTDGPYQVGDRVQVAGDPHEPGQTKGVISEIEEGPAYGITFDGTDMVHRWYVAGELMPEEGVPETPIAPEEMPQTVPWHTPDGAALAFEDEQTGDGRVFAPGALYWTGGPWPLQYADQMNGGHDGARLAGAIFGMRRDGGGIRGDGVLYLTQDAGAEAAMLLSHGAPLGVSVDLDDVDVELIGPDETYTAGLTTASLLPLPYGGWHLVGETAAEWTASGLGIVGESSRMDIVMSSDCMVPASAFQLTAAAGDTGSGGEVIERQESGQYLTRITRARVRGATLVTIPAYANARIAIDGPSPYALAAAVGVTASAADGDYGRVIRHVRKSLVPVTAVDAARFLRMPIETVRRHLARAARKEEVVRIARGTYVSPVATASADVDAAEVEDLDELAASGWDEEGPVSDDVTASAWTAMRDLPPMPFAWFAEPTSEELPPGGAGVNYANGRVFGWVAQTGEPHAGFAKKVTIDGLGRIDTSHFLRQRFTLDDGSSVKAGAFTMNVGHHRDGAECETSSCQFDDTRTVAGIVTVGMNARGMWFSGAAAPWMSEWDRSVFAASQPSYHMVKRDGNWQLRAVLSVPVPGHSSPLLASAVVDRSNMALTAAATMLEVDEAVAAATAPVGVTPHDVASVAPEVEGIDYDRLSDAIVAAMARADQRKADEEAELQALIAEAGKLDADTNGTV